MPQIWFIASQNQELTFTNLTKFLIKNPDKKNWRRYQQFFTLVDH
jgi:hypothetical protein